MVRIHVLRQIFKQMEELNFEFDTTLIGFLFVVFLILKLIGVIDWSWWWVFAPLWIPAVLAIIIVAIFKIVKLLRLW